MFNFLLVEFLIESLHVSILSVDIISVLVIDSLFLIFNEIKRVLDSLATGFHLLTNQLLNSSFLLCKAEPGQH